MTRKKTGLALQMATDKIRRRTELNRRAVDLNASYAKGKSDGMRMAESGVRTQVPSEFADMVWRRFADAVAVEIFKRSRDQVVPEIAAYSRMIAERVAGNFGHMPMQAIEGYLSQDPTRDHIRFSMRIDGIRLGYEIDTMEVKMMRRAVA